MRAISHYASEMPVKVERKSIAITGAWVRVINGMSQVMLEIDGKWREIFPYTNVTNADVSVEIPVEDLEKSQPLGWLYR